MLKTGQKILSEIDPQDISSIEVRKGFAKLHFKDGEEREYDRTIKIKTKKNEQSIEILNKDNEAFDNNLIIFPNPSDNQ